MGHGEFVDCLEMETTAGLDGWGGAGPPGGDHLDAFGSGVLADGGVLQGAPVEMVPEDDFLVGLNLGGEDFDAGGDVVEGIEDGPGAIGGSQRFVLFPVEREVGIDVHILIGQLEKALAVDGQVCDGVISEAGLVVAGTWFPGGLKKGDEDNQLGPHGGPHFVIGPGVSGEKLFNIAGRFELREDAGHFPQQMGGPGNAGGVIAFPRERGRLGVGDRWDGLVGAGEWAEEAGSR